MAIPDAESELQGLVPTLLSLSFFGFVFLWECLFCITVYQKFITFKLYFICTHKWEIARVSEETEPVKTLRALGGRIASFSIMRWPSDWGAVCDVQTQGEWQIASFWATGTKASDQIALNKMFLLESSCTLLVTEQKEILKQCIYWTHGWGQQKGRLQKSRELCSLKTFFPLGLVESRVFYINTFQRFACS